MKTFFRLVIGIMTVFLISCQKENSFIEVETGSLAINIGLSIREHEVKKLLKSFEQVSDFKVTVFRADGTEVLVFESASEMPDIIKLEAGLYYVEAHSDNNLPAEFDNPYYHGVSDIFVISSDIHQVVDITCTLSNTKVSVTWSESVSGQFDNFSATVSSVAGSLVFTKEERRAGYFKPLPLDISVSLSIINPDLTETVKILSGSIPDPLAGRHYEIFVNISGDYGNGTFRLLLDEEEILTEVVEIGDYPVEDDDGRIRYGDILITEIMFDPAVLSDTEGEWIEIYNNSARIINLRNLVLDRDGTNRHTITGSIELLPGEFFVLERTASATDVPNSYVYGSGINLTNGGAVLSLYNESNGTEPGELIFSINYGGTNFPSRAGASISLNPNKMNAVDAVSGTSWCLSSSVYNTGDLGTPGGVNDLCQ